MFNYTDMRDNYCGHCNDIQRPPQEVSSEAFGHSGQQVGLRAARRPSVCRVPDGYRPVATLSLIYDERNAS